MARSPQQNAGQARRANAIDCHVGGRLRKRRTELGWTQERLGEALGLTFQQIQKYEHGTNRIGASRLYELTRILNVPVAYFFTDLAVSTGDGQTGPGMAEAEGEPYHAAPAMTPEAAELVRHFARIEDARARRALIEMARSLAPPAPNSDGRARPE